MFRVGEQLPITVLSPQPWFPLHGLIRRWRPGFRPEAPGNEIQQGVQVLRPRYLSFPGFLKGLDGVLMALGALRTVRRLKTAGRVDVIDAHFAYPDGYAAARVGRWLGLPCTITMRGTEARHAKDATLRRRVVAALRGASAIFAVSDSLRRLALELGIPDRKLTVIGNGVDSLRFAPLDRGTARADLGIDREAKVLVTVGGLVERKGFHRVIECLPRLMQRHQPLHYLIVGSAGPEGDYSAQLRQQVRDLGLDDRVHFLGGLSPERVRVALAAADVSVLATRNEGWANVLLESLACGIPVVATDVGGNPEVICRDDLGSIVPFGDSAALCAALANALERHWDRDGIRKYAVENDWSARVPLLLDAFGRVVNGEVAQPGQASREGAQHA
jgi:glycosyltransferase involved in cell wall biosynthesis